MDTLATDPRPAGAFDMGRSGMFRVRSGRYRIVYEIDETSASVKIRHPGRGT